MKDLPPDYEELRDQAIQYAFGTLEPNARARFEARLERDPDLRKLLADARAMADELGTLVPPLPAPPGVLARIHTRIATSDAGVQPWKRWQADEPTPTGIVPRSSVPFEATAIQGIEVRRLALDPAADRVTLEVRMAPGTSYPAHRHGGPEECFVLEGDIQIGDTEMLAGDFQRLEAGSVHPDQSTKAGCRLLIVSSLHDELLEGC